MVVISPVVECFLQALGKEAQPELTMPQRIVMGMLGCVGKTLLRQEPGSVWDI
jgi:hypothetical protein